MPKPADTSPVAVTLSVGEHLISFNKFVPVLTIEDLSLVTRDFSDISDPEVIRKICTRDIPAWKALAIQPQDINVEQLMAGLTNQLFKCSVPSNLLRGVGPMTVLFRIYGSTVSDLYDTDFEFRVFRILGEHDAAPRLIASFPGGRIEEWVDGNPLLNAKMSNPSILCGVATILSKFHQVDDRAPEFREFLTPTSSLEKNLDRWSKRAVEVFEHIESASADYARESYQLDQISQSSVLEEDPMSMRLFSRIKSMTDTEADIWRSRLLSLPIDRMVDALVNPLGTSLRTFRPTPKCLSVDNSPISSSASSHFSGAFVSKDFVQWLLHDLPCDDNHPLIKLSFCHNDLQENNIMVSESTLRLIDFEYANYNYPAFDVANFFCEMTMDYCVDKFPHFTHASDPKEFPSDEILSLFGSVYLSERLQETILPSHPEVKVFVIITKRFVLASHLIWTFWSIIRAPQAGTNSDFDFIEYARSRFEAFLKWRDYLIANGII